MKQKLGQKTLNNKMYFFSIIIITIVFWSFAFPVIQIALKELSWINLTIIRLFLTCLLFLCFILIKPKKFTKLNKKDIPILFILGATGIIIYHLGLNYGEQYISAGAASLIIATIPIYVVILAAIFLKEKLNLKMVAGIILTLIGVILISTLGKKDTSLEIQYMLGAITVLIAAFVGAIYTIIGKKMLKRYSALSLTAYVFLFGSLSLIPFIRISTFTEISQMSIQGWIAVIFLAIFPTFIAYILWYVALEIKPASELSIYLYCIPILSTIISYFLLNDSITYIFFIGGLIVIIGLYIVNKSQKMLV